jgi:MinD-like ATPase involved in chromosome partitioning or flagellar assembly
MSEILDTLLAKNELSEQEGQELLELYRSDYQRVGELKLSALTKDGNDDTQLKDVPLEKLQRYISALGNVIVVPIASGKGGVAKSTTAAFFIRYLSEGILETQTTSDDPLAMLMGNHTSSQEDGFKRSVIAVDVDRSPKLHKQFTGRLIGYDSGEDDKYSKPNPEALIGLDEFFEHENTLEDLLLPIRGLPNASLIIGALRGKLEDDKVTYPKHQRERLMRRLSEQDVDAILVDVGAGIDTPNLETFHFWESVEMKSYPILVMTESNKEGSHDDAYKFLTKAIDFAIRERLKPDATKLELYKKAFNEVERITRGSRLTVEDRIANNPYTMRKTLTYIVRGYVEVKEGDQVRHVTFNEDGEKRFVETNEEGKPIIQSREGGKVGFNTYDAQGNREYIEKPSNLALVGEIHTYLAERVFTTSLLVTKSSSPEKASRDADKFIDAVCKDYMLTRPVKQGKEVVGSTRSVVYIGDIRNSGIFEEVEEGVSVALDLDDSESWGVQEDYKNAVQRYLSVIGEADHELDGLRQRIRNSPVVRQRTLAAVRTKFAGYYRTREKLEEVGLL